MPAPTPFNLRVQTASSLGFLGTIFCLSLVFPSLFGLRATLAQTAPVVHESYQVVHVYPHDAHAFTQGLIYLDGVLYESTGLNGHSSLRKVELETGKILQKQDVSNQFFAEGLTAWQGRLLQLTWVSHVGFIYDQNSFGKRGEFHYAGEGWGLTHNANSLILSDGSDELRFLNPRTFETVRTLHVTNAGVPLKQLNELEYVEEEIYANIWQTDWLARIDPATGEVLGMVDLSGLLSQNDQQSAVDVLNGIAYDARRHRLFVTGKLWPKLFEIKIVKRTQR